MQKARVNDWQIVRPAATMQRGNDGQNNAYNFDDDENDSDSSIVVQTNEYQGRSRSRRSRNCSYDYHFPDRHVSGIISLFEKRRELEAKIQSRDDPIRRLRAERDKAQQKAEEWEALANSRNEHSSRLEAELRREKQQSQNAQQDAIGWKQQLEEILPLAQIGESVRWRFLEQELLTYSSEGITREDLQQDKIDDGNEAAHAGNGVADAAVVTALLKKGSEAEKYTAAFCTMYWCTSLDAYLAYPPKLKHAMDIHVSIAAGKGIHGGLGTAQQRAAAWQIIYDIQLRYHDLGHEAAEQDPEVDRLLAEAEAMKVEILKSYRQRANNRR